MSLPTDRAAPAQPSQTSAAEVTRQMLARVWQKNEPIFRERLRSLAAAAAAATEGRLHQAQREEAAGEAHKLAGSLGMFGYPEGSALARDLEQTLNGEEPLDASKLQELVARLQSSLPLSSNK